MWVSLGNDENVLKSIVVRVAHSEYTKKHWTLHFKWVNYMAYEIHFNQAIKKMWWPSGTPHCTAKIESLKPSVRVCNLSDRQLEIWVKIYLVKAQEACLGFFSNKIIHMF